MPSGLPIALIVGIEEFGAGYLAKRLTESDMVVIGVGEELPLLEGIRVKLVGNVSEVEKEVDYVFDFREDIESWNKARQDGAKLTLISVNGRKEKGHEDNSVNWRRVEAFGVYGPEMEKKPEGVGYLIEAVLAAVENKNLTLPPPKTKLRMLGMGDLVEAIMRATMLSGTSGKTYEVWGKEESGEDLAKTLIEEAKMTKYKVLSKEMDLPEAGKEAMEKTEEELRWRPGGDLEENIRETLQYFFSLKEEERRYGKKKKEDFRDLMLDSGKEEKIKQQRRFEVEVEEPEVEEIKEEKIEFEKTVARVPVESWMEVEEEKEEVKPKVQGPWSKEEDEEEKQEIKDQNPKPLIQKEDGVWEIKNLGGAKKSDDWEEDEEIEEDETIGKPLKQQNKEQLVVKNSNVRSVTKEKLPEMKFDYKETIKRPTINPAPIIQKVVEKETKKEKGSIGLGGVIKGILLGVVLLGVIIGVFGGMKVGGIVWGVDRIPKLIKEKKYEEANNLIIKTTASLREMDENISGLGLNENKQGRNIQEVIRVAEEVVELEKVGAKASQEGGQIFGAVLKEKDIDWDKTLEGMTKDLQMVESKIGILQARLRGNWSWLPDKFKEKLNSLSGTLEQTRKMSGMAARMMPVMKEMLGLDGKRREYLVLFQNESELRATGGFIGSYGILSFDSGKLQDLKIEDVYQADGQLKGHVEPPEELKKYLGEAAWFMRDANWQADFTVASKDLQWFLEKETGRKVDGVIGINLTTVKKILEVTGEVYVPDFKEKINKNNVYEQAEFYSETNSFPGSNQKQSFLSGLGRQLFESTKNMNQEQSASLLSKIFELLEKNEITIALNNQEAAGIINNLGWDGSLLNGKCQETNEGGCMADYLYVVESNLGVNKANYFVYRNMEEMVDISPNILGRVLKISYENTAKSNNWPGGDYKNYVRIYLPAGVNLAEVSITETGRPETKKTINNDDLTVRQNKTKTEVGFLATIPVLKKMTVEVRYSSNINLNKGSKYSYAQYVQRQPGFGDTGLVTLVSFPSDWQPMQVEPEASVVGGKVLFNQKLDKDIKMGVVIGK